MSKKEILKQASSTALSVVGQQIKDLKDPSSAQDAATKNYVDITDSTLSDRITTLENTPSASATKDVTVSDSVTESLNGTSTTQQGINQELTTAIKSIFNNTEQVSVNILQEDDFSVAVDGTFIVNVSTSYGLGSATIDGGGLVISPTTLVEGDNTISFNAGTTSGIITATVTGKYGTTATDTATYTPIPSGYTLIPETTNFYTNGTILEDLDLKSGAVTVGSENHTKGQVLSFIWNKDEYKSLIAPIGEGMESGYDAYEITANSIYAQMQSDGKYIMVTATQTSFPNSAMEGNLIISDGDIIKI